MMIRASVCGVILVPILVREILPLLTLQVQWLRSLVPTTEYWQAFNIILWTTSDEPPTWFRSICSLPKNICTNLMTHEVCWLTHLHYNPIYFRRLHSGKLQRNIKQQSSWILNFRTFCAPSLLTGACAFNTFSHQRQNDTVGSQT